MSTRDLQVIDKSVEKEAPMRDETDSYESERLSEAEAYSLDNPERDQNQDDWQILRRKSSSKTVYFSKISRSHLDELSLRRQDLELKLASTQLEEAARMDEHKTLQSKFTRVEDLLQALLTFLDCVFIQNKSSHRLCQLINDFVVHDAPEAVNEEFSATIKRSLNDNNTRELNTIKQKIMQTLQEGKRVQELILEYQNRGKDYGLASQNFKALLENAELTSKQFNHLQRQYEGILLNLQHSRCILDQEMPSAISNFMAVLATAFECVSRHFELKEAEFGDVYKLMQNIANTLEESGLVILKRNFKELRAVDGIRCSCCKRINVDE